MNKNKKAANPWKRNAAPKSKSSSLPTPAEAKFKEAQGKLQAAVQKHIQNYESSSEEEDLESDNIIGRILHQYSENGGANDAVKRTESLLHESFLTGTSTCLICISRIKRDSAVWNCSECYCLFHLTCIQRWSKDSIFQQKQILESPVQVRQVTLSWGCPKCRKEYNLDDIPENYYCFCKKVKNPEWTPFLAPHSCGELCSKPLVPECGHKCLLLCHPGPCPPCPVTVNVACFCGAHAPVTQRCSNKEWSCGNQCKKKLSCTKHTCLETCHKGECPPCPKKSLQKCLCKSSQQLRDCATPIWTCDKVCSKPLPCGHHNCSIKCHEGGCGDCPLTKLRFCPCGKTQFQLPCTEETPSCFDTCDKLLECGLHRCHQRCHKDPCGVCLDTVEKSCKCGLHVKEIQCYKSYSCDTKCKRMKDCNKHPCNKKCCDGNCPPCEKPCGRTLNCGNHKCNSVCHRGLCYPCNQVDTVSCRCGATKLSVPCGRKHKTKPPKCLKLCSSPPNCHHDKRENHRCHFGDCPSCRQICKKSYGDCDHCCPAPCHSAVLVKIEAEKPSMPWEQTRPQLEVRVLPCPECVVPIPVACLGKHEISDWPCHRAQPRSCHRACGQRLPCGNHTCSLECHLLEDNCEVCENPCSKARPESCTHDCPKPCHPGACPPCKQMVRIKCHCGLTQPYVACHLWQDESSRDELQSCSNQCPKNYDCGHRCKVNCHSGPCPNPENCKKKVKVTCKCKRIKKEIQCEIVRSTTVKIDCDDGCKLKKEEEDKQQEIVAEQRRKQEEIKNEQEMAKYKRMFEGKKKNRDRRQYNEEEEVHFIRKYRFILLSVGVSFLAGVFFYLF